MEAQLDLFGQEQLHKTLQYETRLCLKDLKGSIFFSIYTCPVLKQF